METVSLGSMGLSWGGELHCSMPLAFPCFPVVIGAQTGANAVSKVVHASLLQVRTLGSSLGDVGVDRLGRRVCCSTAASGG